MHSTIIIIVLFQKLTIVKDQITVWLFGLYSVVLAGIVGTQTQ